MKIKIKELVNGFKLIGKLFHGHALDGTWEQLIRNAIANLVGEFTDDGELTRAEAVEAVGLAARDAADIVNPLDLLADWCIAYAVAHGEDGE